MLCLLCRIVQGVTKNWPLATVKMLWDISQGNVVTTFRVWWDLQLWMLPIYCCTAGERILKISKITGKSVAVPFWLSLVFFLCPHIQRVFLQWSWTEKLWSWVEASDDMCVYVRHYAHRDGPDGASIQQYESKSSSAEDSQGRSSYTGCTAQMVKWTVYNS